MHRQSRVPARRGLNRRRRFSLGESAFGQFSTRADGRRRFSLGESAFGQFSTRADGRRRFSTTGLAASRPVSRVLYRGRSLGDDHPSPPPVARRLKRPTRGLGSATSSVRSLGFPGDRTASSYLALLRAEFAAFHSPSEQARTGLRLCGTGPRLTADGRYPLPCAEELGLSSSQDPKAWPAIIRPTRRRGIVVEVTQMTNKTQKGRCS